MTKLRLLYAGYADRLTGQLGDPAKARPVPLIEGVLGFFLRDEPSLHSFHVEHFQDFNNWEDLRRLLGERVIDKVYELHQEVSTLELPKLSGLPQEELRATMKQSVIQRKIEVDWPGDSEIAERLQRIVGCWEAQIQGHAGS